MHAWLDRRPQAASTLWRAALFRCCCDTKGHCRQRGEGKRSEESGARPRLLAQEGRMLRLGHERRRLLDILHLREGWQSRWLTSTGREGSWRLIYT